MVKIFLINSGRFGIFRVFVWLVKFGEGFFVVINRVGIVVYSRSFKKGRRGNVLFSKWL